MAGSWVESHVDLVPHLIPPETVQNIERFLFGAFSVPERKTNGEEIHPRPSITCATLAVRLRPGWSPGRTTPSVPPPFLRGLETPLSHVPRSTSFPTGSATDLRRHVILPSRRVGGSGRASSRPYLSSVKIRSIRPTLRRLRQGRSHERIDSKTRT